MSLNIDEQEARLIWLNDIMPFVFRHAKTQEKRSPFSSVDNQRPERPVARIWPNDYIRASSR